MSLLVREERFNRDIYTNQNHRNLNFCKCSNGCTLGTHLPQVPSAANLPGCLELCHRELPDVGLRVGLGGCVVRSGLTCMVPLQWQGHQ